MLFVYITIILSALPRYQSIDRREIQLPSNCSNVNDLCPIGATYNKQSCTCNLIDKQLAASHDVLIPRDYQHQTQSLHRNCVDSRVWNGSDCVSKDVLCPGGYQWTGSVCVTAQQSINIRVAVPKKCDVEAGSQKSKGSQADGSNYGVAKPSMDRVSAMEVTQNVELAEIKPVDILHESNEATIQNTFPETNGSTPSALDLIIPPTPIYTTSPFCLFGHIWTSQGCQKVRPTCPADFEFVQGKCVRHSFQRADGSNVLSKWHKRSNEQQSSTKLYQETARSIKVASEHPKAVSHQSNEATGQSKCCTVFSPRYCRQVQPHVKDKWHCFHHKVKGCGNICQKPEVYLRASRQIWTGSLLVMLPPSRRVADILRGGNWIAGDTKIGGLLFLQ